MRHGLPTTYRLNKNAGFTIVELMWAIFILLIIMGAVAAGLSSTLNLSRTNANRVVGVNIAAERIDELRQIAAQDFTQVPANTSLAATRLLDGVNYTVTTTSTWLPKTADTNPCDSVSDNDVAYLRVTASVTWPGMNGVVAPKVTTLLTPPVRQFDQSKGNFGVKITGAAGQPQNNILVTVTPPSGSPVLQLPTGPTGCAFFARLNPLPTGDTYTVALSTPGYVDAEGNATPTKSATVVAGITAPNVTFGYDQAGTLELTLTPGPTSAAPPVALPTSVLPVTVGSSVLFAGKKTFPGVAGPIQTITGLYPDSYTIWSGDCEDSDPLGEKPDNSPYYPAGTREAAIDVPPGGIGTGQIVLQSLEIQVREDDGDPVDERTVFAEHLDPTGECPSPPWTLNLGKTDISGNLRVGIPYGNWQFVVDGESPKTSWPVRLATPPADTVPIVPVVVN